MSRKRKNRACKKKRSPPKANPFRSNFKKVVKNIARESRKSEYNPKVDMNWLNLPMEMRLECVKWMDFKTRCRFRRTSKSEKSLVDAKKPRFDHLQIVQDEKVDWTVIAQKKSESRPYPYDVDLFNKYAPNHGCISAILKHAEVENFELVVDDFYGVIRSILDPLAKFAPFGFKRISINNNYATAFFMKNCPDLEKVDFCPRFGRFSCKDILEAPSLMNVKEFKFAKVHPEDFLKFFEKLVQKWIDNDARIGKSIQFSMEGWQPRDDLSISAFAEKFPDRVIDKTDKEVRFRMNNNTKQILFRQVGLEQDVLFGTPQVLEYCSCKIIPIDMPKSEYANGDGWIQAFYEKDLKRGRKLEKAAEFDAEDEAVWRHMYP